MTETFRQRIGRALGGIPEPKAPEPQTRVVSGGTENNPYVRMGLVYANTWQNPMKKQLDRWHATQAWRDIYLKGGPVTECVNSYPLMALTNGWDFACKPGKDALMQKVQDWADQPHMDLDSIMHQAIIDALICGTAFQEIIPDRGLYNVWGVVPRDASSFWIDFDDYGTVTKIPANHV